MGDCKRSSIRTRSKIENAGPLGDKIDLARDDKSFVGWPIQRLPRHRRMCARWNACEKSLDFASHRTPRLIVDSHVNGCRRAREQLRADGVQACDHGRPVSLGLGGELAQECELAHSIHLLVGESGFVRSCLQAHPAVIATHWYQASFQPSFVLEHKPAHPLPLVKTCVEE